MSRYSPRLPLILPAALLALAGCAAESAPAPIDAPGAAHAVAQAQALPSSAPEPPSGGPVPMARAPLPDAAQIVALRVELPRWDDNRDGLVDPAEFARGLFAMADVDRDARLTAAEFEAARMWLPGEPGPAAIARWDRDADGVLEPRAFASGVITDGLARGWDRDGDRRLRRPEIAAGLTAAFDRDGDGQIGPREQVDIAQAPR